MKDNEENLINALKGGDLTVFEKVVLKFERQIFSYVWGILKDRDDAEDVTQETFIKLYRYRNSLNTEKDLTGLIYTIATRTAYDLIRKRNRSAKSYTKEFGNDYDSETIPDPRTHTITEDMGKRLDLKWALVDIRPDYKSVLALFFEQGMSYEEIGDVLSIPIGTVKTYLHRAKKLLQKKLNDYRE